jgi:hypothetical protein
MTKPNPQNYKNLYKYFADVQKVDKNHWTNMTPGCVKDTCMMIEIIKIGNPKQVKWAERELIIKAKRLEECFFKPLI